MVNAWCVLKLASTPQGIALDQVFFSHPLLPAERRAVRGRSAKTYTGFEAFPWSPAVQALAMLLLRACALHRKSPGSRFVLSGDRATPAATLDYAVSKLPVWLIDVFGVDSRGTPLARRLFTRSNPERKRGGEVRVMINSSFFDPANLRVFLDEQELLDPHMIDELGINIERAFRRSPFDEEEKPSATFNATVPVTEPTPV